MIFDVSDTVVLKQDRSLVGVIEQTYQDPDSVDPLEDELFIGHAPVPPEVLWEYTESWAPPRSYVVVRWWRAIQGRSVVSETDLELLDRSFLLGDSVKLGEKGLSKVGTVTNIATRYILQPIWDVNLSTDALASSLKETAVLSTASCSLVADTSAGEHQKTCPPLLNASNDLSNGACQLRPPAEIEHPSLHALIYDVHENELITANDFNVENYVISQGWLGMVDGHESLVVILLLTNGSIVAVDRHWDLKLIIPDTGKPLVNIPSPDVGDSPVSMGNSADTSVPDYDGLISVFTKSYQRGQCVITNRRNIANGRWIKGSYSSATIPRGRILDVRSRVLSIRWICPNPFDSDMVATLPPRSQQRPYDNSTTFKSTKGLRPIRGFIRYDHGKIPSTDPSTYVNLNQEFNVGDHVRFRDLTVACKEHCGDPNGHGKVSPIPFEQTYGFDLNEFKILCSRQEVQVQWQDGTRTCERSTSLFPHMLPESELCPADIVLHKEGLLQVERGDSTSRPVPYNEMQFVTGDYDLLPQKIGVIQSVDGNERLAQVRWFHEPHVRIISHGVALDAKSSFGSLSDGVEEVSLYEVLTQPALDLRPGDLAVVIPESVPPAIMRSIQGTSSGEATELGFSGPLGVTTLSSFEGFPSSQIFHGLRQIARTVFSTRQPPVQSHPSNTTDWIGEIVGRNTDGSTTVRLGASQQCHDIKVPFERILTIIDRDVEWYDDSMSDDYFESDFLSDTDTRSPIEETIEDENGERMSIDSDEEQWLTDEEPLESVGESSVDAGVSDANSPMHRSPQNHIVWKPIESDVSAPSHSSESMPTQPLAPSGFHNTILQIAAEPQSFAVLDTDPPDNHFFVKNQKTDVAASLRRIQKEYKILSSSLPPGIFVRTFESRLDLLRVMIIGPQDTPYELAPLVVDLHLHEDFPTRPPHAKFHSWTHGLGRINPNLYEDGKICLSLLGTWEGREAGENWSENSSLLQILVSLTGLVLVKDPFYNEAGFEDLAADGAYTVESLQYTEKAYIITRGFIKHALQYPVVGFEDILSWMYLPATDSQVAQTSTAQHRPDLLRKSILRARNLMDRAQSVEGYMPDQDLLDGTGHPSKDGFLRKPSKGANVMLKRQVEDLEKILKEYSV